MRIPMRTLLISSTISLACGGFVFACPHWTRELGLDVWNTFEEKQQVRNSKECEKEMSAANECVMKRISLKFLITTDLIDRRINLSQATEQFLALNQTEPELMTVTRYLCPAASDQESVARQVIGYARIHLEKRSDPSEEIIRHLEKDFAGISQRIRSQDRCGD
jgi:hypothetical protein